MPFKGVGSGRIGDENPGGFVQVREVAASSRYTPRSRQTTAGAYDAYRKRDSQLARRKPLPGTARTDQTRTE